MRKPQVWRSWFVNMLSALLALVWCSSLAQPAQAFVFRDGSRATCRDGSGNPVPELVANGPQVYTGFTTIHQGRWVIIWDPQKLAALPGDSHDYIFFHECAHANGHLSELAANCQGLLDMREADRSSPAIERRIGQFHASLGYMGPQYGMGATLWANTMRCADEQSDDDGGGPDEEEEEEDSRMSTRCRFAGGPRAGQVQDYRGRFAALPLGTPCNDGFGSWGRVVR